MSVAKQMDFRHFPHGSQQLTSKQAFDELRKRIDMYGSSMRSFDSRTPAQSLCDRRAQHSPNRLSSVDSSSWSNGSKRKLRLPRWPKRRSSRGVGDLWRYCTFDF